MTEEVEKMKPNIKNFNAWTIAALIILIAGILLYITWNIRYINNNVWTDVGIYSITIVLVLGGLFGTILSLTLEKTEEDDT
jgi:TRAP-type C4-dicarboxylate transport system permease small subunit